MGFASPTSENERETVLSPSPLVELGGPTRRANQTAAPLRLWLLLRLSSSTNISFAHLCCINYMYTCTLCISILLRYPRLIPAVRMYNRRKKAAPPILSASQQQPVAIPSAVPTNLFSCHQNALCGAQENYRLSLA